MPEPGNEPGASKAEVAQQPTTAKTPSAETGVGGVANPSGVAPEASRVETADETKGDPNASSTQENQDGSIDDKTKVDDPSEDVKLLEKLGAFSPVVRQEFTDKSDEEINQYLQDMAEAHQGEETEQQIKEYLISQILDKEHSEGAEKALSTQSVETLLQMRTAKQGVTDAEDEDFDDISRQVINDDEERAGKDVDADANQATESELRDRWLGKEDENGQRQGGLIYDALATHLSGKELEQARKKLSSSEITIPEAMGLLTGKSGSALEANIAKFKEALTEYVGPFMADIVINHNDFGALFDFLLTNRDYGFGSSGGEVPGNGETSNSISKTDFENFLKDNNPDQRKKLGEYLDNAINASGKNGLMWHGFSLPNQDKLLDQAKKGDVDSIKEIFDQLLNFLFYDSSKTMVRWTETQKILGENLFPSKQQPLSKDVGNYLAEVYKKGGARWDGVFPQNKIKPFSQPGQTAQAKAS